MSYRYGPPLIASSYIYGVGGLGVLGSVIRANTATGPNGAGLLYPCWDSSADDNKEFRVLITSQPSAGSLIVYEDGSLIFSGAPDGTYSANDELFADGSDIGPMTANFLVGAGVVTPNQGHLSFGGKIPSITRTANQALSPSVGHLVLGGYIPVVTQGGSIAVLPGTGHLAFGGHQPIIQQAGSLALNPISGHLIYGGKVPSVVQAGSNVLSPSTGHLSFTGHVPFIPHVTIVLAKYTAKYGTSPSNSKHVLAQKDPGEVVAIGFDFSAATVAVESVSIVAESIGLTPDASPSATLLGSSYINGSFVIQYIAGGLDGAVYEYRALALADDGVSEFLCPAIVQVFTE